MLAAKWLPGTDEPPREEYTVVLPSQMRLFFIEFRCTVVMEDSLLFVSTIKWYKVPTLTGLMGWKQPPTPSKSSMTLFLLVLACALITPTSFLGHRASTLIDINMVLKDIETDSILGSLLDMTTFV